MTRINTVPVECLSDKHLLAEYRELPRIFTVVAKIYDSGKSLPTDIPPNYKLGSGHVKFFYNKLTWLITRYKLLFGELIKREFNMDTDMYHSIKWSAAKLLSGAGQRNDWNPSPEDMYLNMARLAKRATNMPLVTEELNVRDDI